MKLLHATLFALVLPAVLIGNSVDDKSPYSSLPDGAALKLILAEPITIPPRTVEVTVSVSADSDRDGVADSRDWCPKTAEGLKVWSVADGDAKKCKPTDVGCSGKDEWMFDSKDLGKTPNGRILLCSFQIPSAGAERILPAGTVLTTGTIPDDLDEKSKKFFGTDYYYWNVYGKVTASTSKQKVWLAFFCRLEDGYLKRERSGEYTHYAGWSGKNVTIGDLKLMFDITLPEPVVID